MIGGYAFLNKNKGVMDRLNNALGKAYNRIECSENAILFHDNPFMDTNTAVYSSENMTMISQDLLVADNGSGNYATVDLRDDFPDLFRLKHTDAFKDIVSEFRMIIIAQSNEGTDLYLTSNRAGNGRIYYHIVDSGILFSSDIRFLLKIIPFELNPLGVYAIIKYGAIPEPLTISKNISAVPAAHFLHTTIGRGIVRTKAYFQFEFPCENTQVAPSDFDEIIQPAKRELRKSAKFLRRFDPAILISGGIDSSLYAAYLNEFEGARLQGINCTFGDNDPEFEFAQALAGKVNAEFHVGKMETENAVRILADTVALTSHPFADFSSMPIVFILKYMKEHVGGAGMLIEGNGADDCFGFPALTIQSKMLLKQRFPKTLKNTIATLSQNSRYWKWRSHEGFWARVLALADSHEIDYLNHFLVNSPINYLQLNIERNWDKVLVKTMDSVFTACAKDHDALSFEAKTTVRQLMHINSRRWAAKAYSVGENLGIHVVYPYIWRDVLTLQGAIPWAAKVNNGIVKWPLKRMLEEFMPNEFIYRGKSGFVPPFAQWLTCKDFNNAVRNIFTQTNAAVTNIVPVKIINELLDDALSGINLRFPVLNFLWAALFTEMWIQKYKK
ncbi:MAG: hypothetical protein JXR49_08545 [Acidobacteria bacterium]|nr:hypothetical protein [Acidobacteriota bacterium]